MALWEHRRELENWRWGLDNGRMGVGGGEEGRVEVVEEEKDAGGRRRRKEKEV